MSITVNNIMVIVSEVHIKHSLLPNESGRIDMRMSYQWLLTTLSCWRFLISTYIKLKENGKVKCLNLQTFKILNL